MDAWLGWALGPPSKNHLSNEKRAPGCLGYMIYRIYIGDDATQLYNIVGILKGLW